VVEACLFKATKKLAVSQLDPTNVCQAFISWGYKKESEVEVSDVTIT
jgi:hypothetical protein